MNFSLSSGLSALAVFVSVLCGILASAFYRFTINRESILFDDNNDDEVAGNIISIVGSSLGSSSLFTQPMTNVNENDEPTSDGTIMDIDENAKEETEMKDRSS